MSIRLFRPAALFIGLRYTRAKRRNQFISLISLISMLGIALGVVVLITILSVINGFDREIKSQVFGMISPITVNSYSGTIEDWKTLEKQLSQSPGVTAIAPFAGGQAMLNNANQTQPVMLVGIIPQEENGISALPNKMLQGSLSALNNTQDGIVLGEALANQLGLHLGETLTVVTLKGAFSSSAITPAFQSFKVVGIFHAGGGAFGFDTKMAFIHLANAQKLFSLHTSITGFHVNVSDIYAAPRIAAALQTQLPASARAWNWTEQLGGFFDNIRQTKTLLFFIFVLIIAVAVFNLVSTLVMVVKNKQADIAILRTLGATPGTILAIFVVQGVAIGVTGTVLGMLGGVLLAHHISGLSIWIQQVLHVQLISANIYFVNYLPAQLQWPEVWTIGLIALVLSLVATLYPAWRAARTAPVDALRYD